MRRISDNLGAVVQMQAIQDFSHVILDRPFGDADGHGNLAVGLSLCDQRQDLYLSGQKGEATNAIPDALVPYMGGLKKIEAAV